MFDFDSVKKAVDTLPVSKLKIKDQTLKLSCNIDSSLNIEISKNGNRIAEQKILIAREFIDAIHDFVNETYFKKEETAEEETVEEQIEEDKVAEEPVIKDGDEVVLVNDKKENPQKHTE